MTALLTTHRDGGQKTAIVFIHGFMGDPRKTWGNFPRYLIEASVLNDWDIFSLGYPTSIWFDLVGFWKADPDINSLAVSLKTRLKTDAALMNRTAITLIAHSMGGLAVQRALLDAPDLVKRIDSIILLGTPSGGLQKAAYLSGWKRSAADMEEGKPFITKLRSDWEAKFGKARPFHFVSAAGDEDEFVPRSSSHGPFEPENCEVVPGDHLSIVKPSSPGHLSVQLVMSVLTRNGIAYSAARAAEHATYRQTVDELSIGRSTLDQEGMVKLALALEQLQRQDEAIALLRTANHDWYDARGVLAGRLKRRWLLLHAEADGRDALMIYREAFKRAAAKEMHGDAFYNGINFAFMTLALERDLSAAREISKKVLQHCGEADQLTKKYWLLATEAEAHLVLGNTELGMIRYGQAVDRMSSPREKDSMYQQAFRIAAILNDEAAAAQITRIFGY